MSEKDDWRDPALGPRGGSATPVPGRCGAQLRRSDPAKYCKKTPCPDRDRCRLHGGMTPRGILSASYKGRGYSKDLPTRLLDRMVDGLNDPELTSLRSEVALLDARLGELLESLADAGTPEAWSQVKAASAKLRYVADRPDMDDRETVLTALATQLEQAAAVMAENTGSWKEIYLVIDRRRRTVGVELKREQQEEHTLMHSQALYFFQQLLLAIHEEVPDVDVKAKLAARIAKLMNRPDPTPRALLTQVVVDQT